MNINQAAEDYKQRNDRTTIMPDDLRIAFLHGAKQADTALYETRLVLNTILRCFKGVEKTPEQQKYYDSAKIILAKHFNISDNLRTHPTQPVQQVEEKGKEFGSTTPSDKDRIWALENIVAIKEKERKEWADMCIKKQARIEELEDILKHGAMGMK